MRNGWNVNARAMQRESTIHTIVRIAVTRGRMVRIIMLTAIRISARHAGMVPCGAVEERKGFSNDDNLYSYP